MSILAECPACRNKQSVKNKKCKCGEDLDKAKKSKRVKYWITYRSHKGQHKKYVGKYKEFNGYSIEDARTAHRKIKTLKSENRLMDTKPVIKTTFNELTKWYLNLEKVKDLASYDIIKINLNKFNSVFGDMIISHIIPADLENYQAKRKKEKAPGTVDHEIGKAKTMIIKAYDNKMVSDDTLNTFRKIKKLVKRKKGSPDIRDRILSREEFESLIKHSKTHLVPIIATAYYTGMRRGEILNLTWDRIDLPDRMIRLEADDTKDKEARNIPICDNLFKILRSLSNRIQSAGDDNHVFQYKGKGLEGDIRNSLKKACKNASIKYGRFVKGGFIFHDLRHTFNTNMRKAGIQESVIMEITGHSTREMFDRYNKIDEDDTRKAINQLEVFFSDVAQSVALNEKSNKKEIG